MHAAQLAPDALRQRADYYDRIGTRHMTLLREVLGALVPPQPRSPVAAHLWRYDDLREQVMEAGRLIPGEEAERRVLILENLALRGQSCIAQSLYAGLQLVMHGEARRHIGIPSRPCGSCSNAKAPTRPWTVNPPPCAAVTSSSCPPKLNQ